MKKIVFVHNILWSHYKGIVFSEIYRRIQYQWDFRVIHLALNQSFRKDFGQVDYTVHQYPFEVLFDTNIQEVSVWKRAFYLFKRLTKTDLDVILFSGYDDPAYWLPMVWFKLRGKKVGITLDSTATDHPRTVVGETFKKCLLKFVDFVFCYGQKHQAYAQQLGLKPHQIFLRIQATDNATIRRYFLAQRHKVVANLPEKFFLFVGRFSEEKNLFRLLQAFQQCDAKSWGLVMLGNGSLENALKKQVHVENIDNVTFINACPWQEVVKYYAKATVVILPSTSETWGLVVNEAMLCECPLLVSNHCGCSDDLVKNGFNGFTFDPYDIAQLTKLMQQFINEEVSTQQMGEHSYQIIKDFTTEKSANQMINGIQAVLSMRLFS